MLTTLQALATALQDILTLIPQVTTELTNFSNFLQTL